jgi:3alpha(or 20beta)-hydroxysteroid dehydrogenase
MSAHAGDASLLDRVAIVTGAARGLGAVVAEKLQAQGAKVVLADVLEDEGRETAVRLGEAASFAPLDVTCEGDWARVVSDTLAREGHIDVLVNNAGRLAMGSIEHTAPDVVRGVLDVNVLGPFLGMRAVIPAMKARRSGTIVNVSSLDGLLGMNGVAAYSASKWGLRGLTKSAALELGRDGIRVNTVCPAGGNPQMYGPWMEKLVKLIDRTRAYVENRAIPTEAPLDAIASAVVFLTSDASSHCTGIDLPVDGGAHAGHYVEGFNDL